MNCSSLDLNSICDLTASWFFSFFSNSVYRFWRCSSAWASRSFEIDLAASIFLTWSVCLSILYHSTCWSCALFTSSSICLRFSTLRCCAASKSSFLGYSKDWVLRSWLLNLFPIWFITKSYLALSSYAWWVGLLKNLVIRFLGSSLPSSFNIWAFCASLSLRSYSVISTSFIFLTSYRSASRS